MKKLFILFLMFLFMLNVKASYNYSSWSEEYPEGKEEYLIQKEERYRWYKENISDIKYMTIDSIGDRLYDKNDYIYSDYSIPSLTKAEEKEGRIIESEYKREYVEYYDVDSLHLTFLAPFYVSEIDIYCDDEVIDYDITKSNDEMMDTNGYIYYNVNDTADITLDKVCKVTHLELDISYYSNENASLLVEYKTDNNVLAYLKKNLGICTPSTQRIIYFHAQAESSSRTVKFYKYKDIMYKTYTINKEYANGYYAYLDGYIKDETYYKVYYRYITSKVLLFDINNELVYDDKYCTKEYCSAVILEDDIEEYSKSNIISYEVSSSTINKIEEKNNPKTIDNITSSFIILIISIILICSLLLIFKINISNKSK